MNLRIYRMKAVTGGRKGSEASIAPPPAGLLVCCLALCQNPGSPLLTPCSHPSTFSLALSQNSTVAAITFVYASCRNSLSQRQPKWRSGAARHVSSAGFTSRFFISTTAIPHPPYFCLSSSRPFPLSPVLLDPRSAVTSFFQPLRASFWIPTNQ
ncbi:hypothetical protein P170DRAFT_172151 [Aspergillus steynii IBT 23096]|uniref:Uncharacterized protein n=1 Tax=Aspergillus steynii IBT 23096 TaxID=1392250 RepID=A0A2I2G818_9EURO|nr:uncharacterized protein P170DRAFT_172151 [Aspergillus steynii IBT 23096]PLB49008.1 hypothetical protein P170DRAFT_172151 [Aspergillus steynii IBT 23096]